MPRKSSADKPRTFVKTVVEVEGRREDRVVEVPAFEPAPWVPDAPLGIVGARVPRVDAGEKVTGRARFTVDVDRPGMLIAIILRSPIARGTITAFDAAAARSVPGVLGVLAPGEIGRAHV